MDYANGLRCVGIDDIWTGPAREGCPADIRIEWRIEGTVSGALPDRVTARLGNASGPEIGTVAADTTQAFDLRRDLGPADAGLRPVAGSVVTLTSTRGGTRVVAVTVRN